ncbi:hypothetical protein GCM10010425_75830 [Streptomyces spororaveus]|uniref:Uncharacterized protein n=1 Tax=Streptomyces spororaveus TaxID=284039 RepID=A0ABQ3T3K7_9ACTN|nr:hypothetical protein Sspor_05370 [Streptomyces spororaveus]
MVSDGDLGPGQVQEVEGAGSGGRAGARGVLKPELGALHPAGQVQQAREQKGGRPAVGPGVRVQSDPGELRAVDQSPGEPVESTGARTWHAASSTS